MLKKINCLYLAYSFHEVYNLANFIYYEQLIFFGVYKVGLY